MGDSRPDVEGTLQVRCTVVSCTRSGTKQHTPLPSPFRVDLVASRQRTRDEFPSLPCLEIVLDGVPSTESNTRGPVDHMAPTCRPIPDRRYGSMRHRMRGAWPCGREPGPGRADTFPLLSDVTCQLLPFLLGSVQSNGDARMMLSSALSCTPRPAPPSASLTTRAPLAAPVLPRGRELRGAHPGRGRRSSHASYTLTVDDSPVQR